MRGLIVDKHMIFAPQTKKLAVSARKRLGFLRRASRYLHGKGQATVYKAFVRPRLECSSLAWMGAAQSNVKRLDRVQDAAAFIIVDEAGALDSLEHRRRVGSLMYLYKIQSWVVPDKLRQMIPPRLERPPRGRTRASALEHDT